MFVLDKNIVQIYSIFEDMGYLYLVMEYIEEGAFLKKLKMHKGIKYESIEEHFLDVSCALKSIHTSHCLLRNLKPENIGTLYVLYLSI